MIKINKRLRVSVILKLKSMSQAKYKNVWKRWHVYLGIMNFDDDKIAIMNNVFFYDKGKRLLLQLYAIIACVFF